MNRDEEFLSCEPFQLVGGRRASMGKYDEIPYHVDVPGWIADTVIEVLERAGFPPSQVLREHGCILKPNSNEELALDRIQLSVDVDAAIVNELLFKVWSSIRHRDDD